MKNLGFTIGNPVGPSIEISIEHAIYVLVGNVESILEIKLLGNILNGGH